MILITLKSTVCKVDSAYNPIPPHDIQNRLSFSFIACKEFRAKLHYHY